MKNGLFPIFVLLVLLNQSFLLAQPPGQENLQEQYQVIVTKGSQKIMVDGDLSESIWKELPVLTDFWMSFPVDDQKADPDLQTEVMVTYDDEFIYFGVTCHGAGPYMIQSLKRDNPRLWRSDCFSLVVDPVNEKSNGFVFGINTEGVQIEALVPGQTGRRGSGRSGINVAWDNKWFSNAKIYSDRWTAEIAIPFKSLRYSDKKIWGINFFRGDTKSNSYHTWSPVPLQFRSFDLGYTGALIWDTPPPRVKRNISVIPYLLGSYFKDYEEQQPKDFDFKAGVDAKIAVTSSMNLDVTINPDFSQVDVDEQVTNLTTVNVRFPEKRLFFLENSDLFQDFGIPPMRPFFSRRIGLDEDGNSIPILFGLRLSGNLNKDLRLGLMNMQTRDQGDFNAQNYTSFAMHHRVFKRSVIKGYFHNRQAFESGEIMQTDHNRAGGLEFDYRSEDGRWRSFGGYGLSFSEGVSSQNYFYNAAISYDGKVFNFYSNIAGVGDNYVPDMGFMPRINHYDASRDTTLVIGFHHLFSRVGYTIYPEDNPKVTSHAFSLRHNGDVTTGNELIGNEVTLEYKLNFANTSEFQAEYNWEEANLLFPFDFIEGEPLPAGLYRFHKAGIEYETDRRKLFGIETGIEYGGFYNGTRLKYKLELKYRIQPVVNFGLNFELNELDFPEPFTDETLFLISPKVEINFSKSLFWSTFLQFNTQDDNFNINSRIQWRFAPMSDLFIVYTDNYALEIWGAKNRGLVLKWNYWLNL